MFSIILEWIIRFLIFFVTYVFTSRIISIPVALVLQFPRFIVFLMVLILDILQIPLFGYIYMKGFPQIKFINRLISKLPSKEKVENSKLGRIAQHLGSLGLVVMSAVPTFGGGIWSAVLLARILHLINIRGFLFIAIGSVIGCYTVVYGYDAIFQFLGIFQP